jgi:stearoyl-CoA desaturase (Delta-9 desaturase)
VILSGVFTLSWWGAVAVTLVLTHITIAAVTIYLHRMQAHRALDLHPLVSHCFRFWLWLTTGMITREWIAIHRKHHAKCETSADPHSPKVLGIKRVLWGGVFLYVKEARNPDTMTRYGHGAPSDWIEKHVYSEFPRVGVTVMALLDIALFGLLPGLLIYGVQMAWIPFWAAGVINGLGHHSGYRTHACKDVSTNIVPWGILIGGEELHNNHHAFVTSAKFSNRWYEVDLGWIYIRTLEVFGLARVKRVAPKRRLIAPKAICDLDTLQAIVTHRYELLARYGRTVKRAYVEEIGKLKMRAQPLEETEPQLSEAAMAWLPPEATQPSSGRLSRQLRTLCSMGQELSALWETQAATREQLLRQLQDWCRRAEASEIVPLQRFCRELRRYG